MQETKIVKVNNREIPVLISDEKEALLAAKTAGRAVVGLWSPGTALEDLSAADYVVESLSDATDEYLERVVRRVLGLPWKICETERLVIRELFGDDFDEVYSENVGRGFGSVEEFLAYVKNQYAFFEFGLWALVSKETGELIGVAGLSMPDDDRKENRNAEFYELTDPLYQNRKEVLALGYHIFARFRCQGYGIESCRAILQYGRETFGVNRFLVRIAPDNEASKRLAGKLGFVRRKENPVGPK